MPFVKRNSDGSINSLSVLAGAIGGSGDLLLAARLFGAVDAAYGRVFAGGGRIDYPRGGRTEEHIP